MYKIPLREIWKSLGRPKSLCLLGMPSWKILKSLKGFSSKVNYKMQKGWKDKWGISDWNQKRFWPMTCGSLAFVNHFVKSFFNEVKHTERIYMISVQSKEFLQTTQLCNQHSAQKTMSQTPQKTHWHLFPQRTIPIPISFPVSVFHIK